AWMIERCGFKGAQDGAAGVSERHALVLVNHGAASGREIAALARRIRLAVEERFGLRLEFEPRLVEFGRD
ncbi:MAG: UDP-N-acetylenolpyruvoylglucosamine reductase, partial [Gammaproteobacteria bacterium]|nr:UDP-N-acetylenolpyruvoylglucosamine reductase [Gammaproteobacteria bacterium]